MVKKTVLLFIFLSCCITCKKSQKINEEQNRFVITISIDDADGKKAFLHKFNTTTSEIIDSVVINNSEAIFKGSILYPERQLLTVEQIFGGKLIIVENDSIFVKVLNNNLIESDIYNSELNTKLITFQKEIEKIYNQVDALFPKMQRARLENDSKKLKLISNQIKQIEIEAIEYSFNYSIKNVHSFIAPMILNDLSKRDSIDLGRINKYYNKFTNEIKNSIDSKELKKILKKQL